jgi:hypothetical protein
MIIKTLKTPRAMHVCTFRFAADNSLVYSGQINSNLKRILKSITPANSLLQFVANDQMFYSLKVLALSIGSSDTVVDVAISIRLMNKCHGSVDVEYTRRRAHMLFTNPPCKNLIKSDQILCKHCRDTTCHLVLGCGGFDFQTMKSVDNDDVPCIYDVYNPGDSYQITEYDTNTSSTTVTCIFDEINKLLCSLSPTALAKYLACISCKYAHSLYDNTVRNQN